MYVSHFSFRPGDWFLSYLMSALSSGALVRSPAGNGKQNVYFFVDWRNSLCLFCSPKVQCLCHKGLPQVPVLSQFYPLRIPTRYFGMNRLKLSLYRWLRLRSIFILCRFPTVCICDLSYFLMSRSSHLCWFYRPIIFRGIQIWRSLCTFRNIMYNLEHTPSYFR